MRPPPICSSCGAEVPPKARACPECGADEKTGWSETAHAQRLGLPDDTFDYNEFVRGEFGPSSRSVRPHGIRWIWWLVALILVALMVGPLILRLVPAGH